MSFLGISLAVIAALGGAAAGYYLPSSGVGANLLSEEKKLEEAKDEAEQIRAEAKEKTERMRQAFEREENSMEESLSKLEEVVAHKEGIMKRREDRNKGYEGHVKVIEKEVQSLGAQSAELVKNAVEKLAAKSGLNKEQALEQAREGLHAVITENKEIRQSAELEEFQDDIMRHAQATVQIVVQRLGVPSSVDKNSSSLKVRDDKFKGLLVGRDGNNIKYFETLLPVSIIFNLGDAKTIHVGGLNLLRRNIAKVAIEKLQNMAKKRKSIDHPMIKKAVEEAEAQIMKECDKKGEWALRQVELDPKKVDPELINYMGRLYFRTSYGQNVLYHSLEMAHAARLIAEMIGADPQITMQATFYHDIGKAIDHDVGGSHDDLTKEILEKHNFDPAIVYAAYVHHDKGPCKSAPDFIVKAADSISGGRPGARQESIMQYFERIKQLEDAAKSFDGVNKVYAISAGREIRVLVNKDKIKDDGMQSLADNVAEKISEDVSFPGIIKVNLIRLTKSVDYARDKQKKN